MATHRAIKGKIVAITIIIISVGVMVAAFKGMASQDVNLVSTDNQELFELGPSFLS